MGDRQGDLQGETGRAPVLATGVIDLGVFLGAGPSEALRRLRRKEDREGGSSEGGPAGGPAWHSSWLRDPHSNPLRLTAPRPRLRQRNKH